MIASSRAAISRGSARDFDGIAASSPHPSSDTNSSATSASAHGLAIPFGLTSPRRR